MTSLVQGCVVLFGQVIVGKEVHQCRWWRWWNLWWCYKLETKNKEPNPQSKIMDRLLSLVKLDSSLHLFQETTGVSLIVKLPLQNWFFSRLLCVYNWVWKKTYILIEVVSICATPLKGGSQDLGTLLVIFKTENHKYTWHWNYVFRMHKSKCWAANTCFTTRGKKAWKGRFLEEEGNPAFLSSASGTTWKPPAQLQFKPQKLRHNLKPQNLRHNLKLQNLRHNFNSSFKTSGTTCRQASKAARKAEEDQRGIEKTLGPTAMQGKDAMQSWCLNIEPKEIETFQT